MELIQILKNMKYLLLIILYLAPKLLVSQAVVITKVDANRYPIINTEFIILDENDKKTLPLDNELELFENGIRQDLTITECNNNQIQDPISVVLTIDNSSSMLETDGNTNNRSEVVREAAKKYIDLLHPQSEVAITYFSTDSKIAQLFTSDKSVAKQSVDDIPEPFGATYITNSFLNETDGNFKALENAKHKKVIIFLTDGTSNEVDIESILGKAFAQDATIYTMSVYTQMDRELLTIADTTGGIAFDNIQDYEKIDRVYKALSLITSGIDICKTSYISSNCELERNIELIYKDQFKDKWQLKIPKEKLVEYRVAPSEIYFYNDGSPTTTQYSNIVSNKDSLIITEIISKYSETEILEPPLSAFPIRLDFGERLRIKFRNTNGTKTKSDLIQILSNSCMQNGISIYYKTYPNSLEVETPNGGEVYYVGSDEQTKWLDSNSNKEYGIEYSTNSGFSWENIVEDYNARDFIWENIPDSETEEALYKVSRDMNNESRIKTKNLGVLDTNFFSTFEKILTLENGNFLVSSTFRGNFIYRDLYVDTVGQETKNYNRIRKILMILDDNLDVIKYKVFISNQSEYFLTTMKDNVYMLVNYNDYLLYDTLNYEPDNSNSSNAIILKLDENLDYLAKSEIINENPLVIGSSYFIDFESSDNYLHIYGASSKSLNYNDELVIDNELYTNIVYLARIDENLNYSDLVFWEREYDKLDVLTKAIIPQDDDSVVLWGAGTGAGFLNLDSNYTRNFSLIANYQNNNLFIKNYISYDESFDASLMDYTTYRDINYYLIRTTDTTYLDSETKTLGDDESKIRVLAVTDDNELIWDIELDNFTLSKNLSLFNERDLLVVGITNESFTIGDTTIPRESNLHFVASFSLFQGKFNWVKYTKNAIYLNKVTTSDNKILTTGKFFGKVDFGNGFEDEVNTDKQEFDKQYLWLLESDNDIEFDISDSLWSIRKPSFEYIDTIDFGRVYSFTKKDSLVLSFITQIENEEVIIENITVDDFRYSTDFAGPVTLDGSIDVTFSLTTEFAGAGLSKGTIFTSQGNYSFYLLVEEIDDSDPITINAGKLELINFGDVFISEDKTLGEWVAINNGEAVIGIDSVIIVDDENNEFSYNITSDNNFIFAGDSLKADFTYAPKLAGISEAEVHFFVDVLRDPIIAKLTGNGITKDSVRIKVLVDTLSSFPDKLITIPVKLEISESPVALDMKRLEVDIEYNATLLLPFRLEDEGTVVNKVRKMTIEFDTDDIENLYKESRFLPTIGNSISTELRIVDVRVINGKDEIVNASDIDEQNGLFTLDGVCFTDGHYRLYEERNPTKLSIEMNNGSYFANINLIEKGGTNLSVFDINGKLVTTLIARDLEHGELRTEINTDNISSGMYIIQLETATQTISKIFTISK